jgi:hypothetical protein
MREHPSADGLVLWDAAWESYRKGALDFNALRQLRRSLGLRVARLSRTEWEDQWGALEGAGLKNPLSWALTGMDPTVAESWLAECRKHGWEQWVALGWAAVGRANKLFLAAGVLPDEYPHVKPFLAKAARRIPSNPNRSTGLVVALADAWGAHDIPLSVAWQWRKLGFFDPAQAAAWRNRGFSPLEAAHLDLLGLSAQDGAALHVTLSRRDETDVDFVDDDDIEFSELLDWAEFGDEDEDPDPTFH